MVLKTMSSNEVKQRWGSVMSTAKETDNAVIVESHGTPLVAVISFGRFEKLREFEKREQRERALKTLREIEARYDGRNDDLTEEEIEELADRFSREFVDELVAEGKVVFEHDAAQ
ncbi:MAG: type II toxin-antitoxin system prevent-host-death family antitoxin [Chloroflexia bacterium]|jgi:prevent-host-death family protein|nr:type II toxin-antitoxin system prevent-host-death family antitoxin [Chloroflexia bacterium]